MIDDTIVAVATPYGVGGISIVRISGPSALKIADDLFCAKNGKSLNKAIHGKLNYGTIKIGEIREVGLAVVFFKPKSFTGELVVEFQVHGGILIAKKIVEECIKRGARLADKGEFSKRAFLNGKASLDSLEGMIDMINAESESELKAAFGLYSGTLKKTVEVIENELTEALAGIEVGIDYPDEVDDLPTKDMVMEIIFNARGKLEKLIETKKLGKTIKDGVLTLILGKPNVGKSSLLNAIIGEDRAIVTEHAGTTRDIVKETFIYDGIKFQLLDTAGIRDSKDEIESIGINKAIENINIADLILFVIDSNQKLTNEDLKIYQQCNDKNLILVFNKTDKLQNKQAGDFFDNFNGDKIKVSTYLAEGIDDLLKIMKSKVEGKTESNVILVNERHIKALELAKSNLERIRKDFSFDIIAFEIKKALDELGKISGKTVSEEVINKIFSKFCVGK